MTQKVLSYDLGGTKVAAGVVNSRGKILEEIRVPVLLKQGKEAVLQQLSDLGSQLISRHPSVKTIGIASAGPMNPETGELLDPTNFRSAQGSWGKVPLTQIIRRRLKLPTFLENDAAAAILAERWVGAAKKYSNSMILTLGTGLGTGIICNGELVRSGRNLHPEAGHLVINYDDTSAPCNCGNWGCAEAYLSGMHFERRSRIRLGNPNLTAKNIADLARKGDPGAVAAFQEYSKIMAVVLYNYARIYSPEIVVFTGSFTKAYDLFLDETRKQLEGHLLRQSVTQNLVPKLAVSALENNAGLIGGAYIALQR